MTTPPGRESRSAAPRGGSGRPRSGAGSGWASPGDSDAPRFTPAGPSPDRRDSGRPAREPGRPSDGGGHKRDQDRADSGRPSFSPSRDRDPRDREPDFRDRDFRDRDRQRDQERERDRDSPGRPPQRASVRDDAGRDRGSRDSGDHVSSRPGPRPSSGQGELLAGPGLRWIGSVSPKQALLIFFGASVLGAIATLVTGGDPGGLLGTLIVIGAVVAALIIERRSLYLLFPMPALSYLVLAILTGLIHDGGSGTSTTQLGLGFLQWIGNGFFAMCAATILVGVIFGARLLASRQLVSGTFPMSEQRPSTARSNGSAASSRRPRSDDFDARGSNDSSGDRFNTEGWRISTRQSRTVTSRDPRRAPGGGTRRTPRNSGWDDRDR